jgi:hypothetical protein
MLLVVSQTLMTMMAAGIADVVAVYAGHGPSPHHS